MAKKYVRIQSKQTINVTPGLQNTDVTNPDAHIPDRLKVSPIWPKHTVMIREGVGIYPSEIAKWPTVLALSKDGILTIGEYLDDGNEIAEQQKAKVAGVTTIKDINLNNVAQ